MPYRAAVDVLPCLQTENRAARNAAEVTRVVLEQLDPVLRDRQQVSVPTLKDLLHRLEIRSEFDRAN